MNTNNLPTLIILKSGVLDFPEINLQLNPRTLTPNQCRIALKDYKSNDERDVTTGYYWQYYKVRFEGHLVGLSFCFYGTKCFSLDMSVSLPTDRFEDNWPTEDSMLLKIDFFKKAFKKQFNGSLNYGSAYHIFDQRSYCDVCGISYHKHVKKLDYAVRMQRKREDLVDFAEISANGVYFYITTGTTRNNVLIDPDNLQGDNKRCENEKICLEQALKAIENYKINGYKIKKHIGKAMAYDLINPEEL